MSDLHSIILLAAIAAVGVLQILLLRKRNAVDFTPVLRGLEDISKSQERTERSVRDDIAKNRAETATAAREARLELAGNLKAVGDTLNQQLAAFSEQLGNLTQSSQQRLESLKDAVEARLKSIQEDNTKQLDQMRATVDEKLQGTLEKRLGESFKQVSEWLEQVHKGLGEMQTLATGVGDLKKVLTNVKTRGTWGEVQLGAMLEQVLAPDQYAANVATKGEGERARTTTGT